MKNTYKILLATTILLSPAQNTYGADAGFLDFFFPSMRKYAPDPSQTLKAPFAYGVKDASEVEMGKMIEFQAPSPDNTVPLDRQHRVNTEMITWLDRKIPELLNISKSNYSEQFQIVKSYFTDQGWRDYSDFLARFGVAQVLKSQTHDTRAFNKSPPIVTNQESIDGRYIWVFEVPMTLSFMRGNSNDYKDLDVYNREVTLTLQLARYADVAEPGVLIERWEAVEDKAQN